MLSLLTGLLMMRISVWRGEEKAWKPWLWAMTEKGGGEYFGPRTAGSLHSRGPGAAVHCAQKPCYVFDRREVVSCPFHPGV